MPFAGAGVEMNCCDQKIGVEGDILRIETICSYTSTRHNDGAMRFFSPFAASGARLNVRQEKQAEPGQRSMHPLCCASARMYVPERGIYTAWSMRRVMLENNIY